MMFYYFFIDKMSRHRIQQHRLYSQPARRFCFIGKDSFGLASNTLFSVLRTVFPFYPQGDSVLASKTLFVFAYVFSFFRKGDSVLASKTLFVFAYVFSFYPKR